MPENYYPPKVVTEVTGLKSTRLNQWINRDLMRPSYEPGYTGSPFLYSVEDVVTVMILKASYESGFSLQIASKLAKAAIKKDTVIINSETGDLMEPGEWAKMTLTIDIEEGFRKPIVEELKKYQPYIFLKETSC